MSHRILVADDSSTIQKVIKIALNRYGVEIIEASSFVEALGEVTKTNPNALIIDASLPGAHGADDFAKLKEQANGVPLLVLVGTYEKVDEGSFEERGLGRFLKKPFESSDIVNQVNEMLNGALKGEQSAPAPASVTPPPPSMNQDRVPPPPPVVSASPTINDNYPHADDGNDGPSLNLSSEGMHNLKMPSAPMRVEAENREDNPPSFSPAMNSNKKGMPAFASSPEEEEPEPQLSAPPPLPPPPMANYSQARRGEPTSPKAPEMTVNRDNPRFATTEIRPPAPAVKQKAQAQNQVPTLNEADVAETIENIVNERLALLVREAVEDYCDRHFNSLAKEVIGSELRRLADEKARHLVDS